MTRIAVSATMLLATTWFSIPTEAVAAGGPSGGGYLLSYFKGNGEDGLHLAYSRDGLKFTALGGGRSYLKPEVGRHKLMRDPSIVRAPDGVFHMVWTSSWNDRIIGYAHSSDLIHWSPQRAIPVMMHEPKARNSWAPELFYDGASRRFVIVWSTTIPGRFPQSAGSSESNYNHRLYYTTTRDFKSFAPTKLFYDPGHSVIDGFLATQDGKYLLFFKDETLRPTPRKVILLATADKLEGPYTRPTKPICPQDWVEGPSAIRIGDTWHVYFDCYRKHRYGLILSKDLEHWTDASDRLSVPPGTRHGTVFRIDEEAWAAVLRGTAASDNVGRASGRTRP